MVSIGMPVYNGGRFLRGALDSLLAQDYPDFEIVISDNASNDETEGICREYASKHARIRYYRPDQNMGAIWNFTRVQELARGEYFMWAAHDDLRHPEYLARCVAALEANPNAFFCCTGVRLIDDAGQDVSDSFPFRSFHPTGSTPCERLRALIRSTAWFDTYSLMRSRALAETKIGSEWGGDVVLLAELCLRGEVAEVPDKLFDYRYYPAKTAETVAQTVSTSDSTVSVSWSDLAADLMESVGRSPLSFLEKLRLRWMIIVELCFRNAGIGRAMRPEGFKAAHRAFVGGKYGRAITLASIRILKQPAYFRARVANSARYRGSNLKRAISPRMDTPSGRKPGY
jgi:Glycosyltransferases involved in cell wall biogenesis